MAQAEWFSIEIVREPVNALSALQNEFARAWAATNSPRESLCSSRASSLLRAGRQSERDRRVGGERNQGIRLETASARTSLSLWPSVDGR